MKTSPISQDPLEIPKDKISPEALKEFLKSYILREGTDYGAVEVSLESKLGQLEKQLQQGKIKIIFDPNDESVTLMTDIQWGRLLAKN